MPLTVYQLAGQELFAILDGERRHRCCADLEREGLDIDLPANVVEPPDKVAGLLYMFSIHNFREAWELMPTALSLKVVMQELGEDDDKALSRLTGLGMKQIERCKILLAFPARFQQLSLDPDPETRIPPNFWIEAHPVISLAEAELPDLAKQLGRDGISDKLVEKYRNRGVKSVVHLRRIMEAYQVAEERRQQVLETLRRYILDVSVETRAAFDEFVVESRRVQNALRACEDFVEHITRAQVEYIVDDRDVLVVALERVESVARGLIDRLEGSDAPDSPIRDQSSP